MKTFLLILITLLSHSFWSAPAYAEKRQFGGIVYQLPERWGAGRERNGTVAVLPRFKDCKSCYVWMATATPLKGRSIGKWLQSQTARFIKPKNRRNIKVTSSKIRTGTMNKSPVAVMTIRVKNVVWLLTARQHGRSAVLLGYEAHRRDIKPWRSNNKAVQSFYKSLRFIQSGDSGILPVARKGNLSGVYWGVVSDMSVGLDAMPRQSLKHHLYVFYRDGHFYQGTPPTGIASLNRKRLLRKGKNSRFGVYRVNANQVFLTYASGRKEKLARSGKFLRTGRLKMKPVKALPTGTVLNGGISSFTAVGNAVGAGSGGSAFTSSTTFMPNGTYLGKSFGTSSTVFSGGGGLTTSQGKSTGGRYQVKDGVLVMHPSGGGVPRTSMIFKVGKQVLIGNKRYKPK